MQSACTILYAESDTPLFTQKNVCDGAQNMQDTSSPIAARQTFGDMQVFSHHAKITLGLRCQETELHENQQSARLAGFS
jgi:hypothetical protein